MRSKEYISNSEQETVEIGCKIGSGLKGGEVLAIYGPLGSGKTHLIKGIARGLGAKNIERSVTSPTFVLVNEYCGRVDIYHIDAYRLENVNEFERIGFDDFCYPGSVVLIEWADKVRLVLGDVDCIWIGLTHLGRTQRKVHVGNSPLV